MMMNTYRGDKFVGKKNRGKNYEIDRGDGLWWMATFDDDDIDWCGFFLISFDLATALDLGSCTINNRAATVAAAGSLSAGLSVSHDSVFGLDISSQESDAYFTHHHRNQPAAESLPSSASFQYMVNKIKYLNEWMKWNFDLILIFNWNLFDWIH